MPGSSDAHPDLRNFRLWLDRIASDYARLHVKRSRGLMLRDYRELELLRFALDGGGRERDVEDDLRRLIAAGVASYQHSLEIPSTPVPETLVLDFVVDAMWPVVIARELPRNWLAALTAIASHPLADCVYRARAATAAGSPYSRQVFQRTLSDREYVPGILHILRDLNDPRRGASFLQVIAETTGNEAPEPKVNPRRLLRWILGGASAGGTAAVTGVIGNRTDALALEVWEWLAHTVEVAANVASVAPNSDGAIISVAATGVGVAGVAAGAAGDTITDALTGFVSGLWG